MTPNDTLDRDSMVIVDEYEYHSDIKFTIAKHREDSCNLYWYKNGELLGKVSFADVAKFAEIDYVLKRK